MSSEDELGPPDEATGNEEIPETPVDEDREEDGERAVDDSDEDENKVTVLISFRLSTIHCISIVWRRGEGGEVLLADHPILPEKKLDAFWRS